MTKLNREQLESVCELIDTRLRDAGHGPDDIPAIIAGILSSRGMRGAASPEELAKAYRQWKRRQKRIEEGYDEPSRDLSSLPAPDARECTAGALQDAIGALLAYLGGAVLRARHVERRSETRLREGENARGVAGPGEISLPDGTRPQWIVAAVLVDYGGKPVRALPECRLRAVTRRGDERVAQFSRITLAGTEANLRGIASSFGALMLIFRSPNHSDGVRALAAALGEGTVTAANLSHHARRLAGKAMANGGHARFQTVKM